MSNQDAFGIVDMFYAVAITAFPNLDPKLLVMILLAVPVPVIVWFFMAKVFASSADKTTKESNHG